MRKNRGFTLIEVIVVAAIIAILAGILVPMIFSQIDEARIARAQGDCKSISTAILMFRKDTGKLPYFDPGVACTPFTTLESAGNAAALAASAPLWQIGGNPVSLGTILNLPAAGLVTPAQQPCYNGTAKTYLAESKSDPWGNIYIVNAFNFGTSNPVWVISAGPNGTLETAPGDLALGGDDIGVRVQ